MESINKSNNSAENGQIMTLQSYYRNLPASTHPKTEFITEICRRTNVSFTAARNWVIYGMKPNNPKHIKELSKITGISPEHLWND